jgi:hypothetical protein
MGYKIGEEVTRQYGGYLLITKPKRGKAATQTSFTPETICWQVFLGGLSALDTSRATDEDVELRDVRDGHVVWAHYFPQEVPSLSFGDGKVLFRWTLDSAAGRDELAKFPALKAGTEKTDYLLEQVDMQKGTPVAEFVLKTNNGSFSVMHTLSVGDWVIASASGNQVLTYSTATGQERGHFFGSSPSASTSGLLALESEVGQINVYDMATSQLKQQYTFSDAVSFQKFSPDGNRLFVMTAGQTAYILDVTSKQVR